MHSNLAVFTNPELSHAGASTLLAYMPDDTMHGEIEVGDKIHIEPSNNNHFDNAVYAFFWCGIFMVKRLEFTMHSILVIPANKYYLQWEIPCNETDNLLIVGRVSTTQGIRNL